MPLLNYEINVILSWSWNCFVTANAIDGHVPTFAITDTKFYVPVATLLTQDNVKQLKSGFKRTISWNKYQSTKPILRLINWSKFSRSK